MECWQQSLRCCDGSRARSPLTMHASTPLPLTDPTDYYPRLGTVSSLLPHVHPNPLVEQPRQSLSCKDLPRMRLSTLAIPTATRHISQAYQNRPQCHHGAAKQTKTSDKPGGNRPTCSWLPYPAPRPASIYSRYHGITPSSSSRWHASPVLEGFIHTAKQCQVGLQPGALPYPHLKGKLHVPLVRSSATSRFSQQPLVRFATKDLGGSTTWMTI